MTTLPLPSYAGPLLDAYHAALDATPPSEQVWFESYFLPRLAGLLCQHPTGKAVWTEAIRLAVESEERTRGIRTGGAA